MQVQQSGTDLHSGLEEVKALSSAITDIGDTYLRLRGIDIAELAEHSTFEETIYLLWYGRLPGKTELDKLKSDLQANVKLPREILSQVNHIPRNAHPMAVLRTLVSALALYDEQADQLDFDSNFAKAKSIMAKMPVLVTAVERHRKGKSLIEPRDDLTLAQNLLYMLDGEMPDDVATSALNTTLILYSEHELNASTFAARVATGTVTDMYSAITCALATLKGILHGGANEMAMQMILDISEVEMVEEYIEKELGAKRRIMGFGHRVYKNGDPRHSIVKKISKELCEAKGFEKYHQVAEAVESYMKEKKGLLPNVDLYSALVFYALGFATDMYTSIFALSRTSGWVAHILEQFEKNRLIRPRAIYDGPAHTAYKPIDQR